MTWTTNSRWKNLSLISKHHSWNWMWLSKYQINIQIVGQHHTPSNHLCENKGNLSLFIKIPLQPEIAYTNMYFSQFQNRQHTPTTLLCSSNLPWHFLLGQSKRRAQRRQLRWWSCDCRVWFSTCQRSWYSGWRLSWLMFQTLFIQHFPLPFLS